MVALLVGCGASDRAAPAPTTAPGLDLGATLDSASGAVTLPFERFIASGEEEALFDAAREALVARCAQELGVPYYGIEHSYPEEYRSDMAWGPWTVDQAERFANTLPLTPADQVANGLVPAGSAAADRYHPNFELTDDQRATVESSCTDSEDYRYFEQVGVGDGPWDEQIAPIWNSLPDRDDVQTLLGELGACYRAAGLQPVTGQPWLVTAGSWEISEEQVTIALQIVTCKDEVDFTRRIAGIEAGLQAAVVLEHADELVAQRAELDAAVQRAREVLAENADVIHHGAGS